MDRIKKVASRLASHFSLLLFYLGAIHLYFKRNKFEVVGRENFPKGVNILICPNHTALPDSFGVGVSVLRFEDALLHYDRIPWNAPDQGNFFHNGIYRFIFGLLKNIPVTRGVVGIKLFKMQVAKFVDVLETSNLVLFFEGTRSRDGKIGPCKSGVQLTIQKATELYGDNFRVVPIRIVNGEQIMPIEVGFDWRKLGRGVKGKIIIGKPIIFTEEDLADRKLIGKKVQDTVIALYP